ncbi:sensor histidine kinase [Paludibaculum fermentans]|uniref:sensor histidine kinase n=1 Tax=Paludibaculum fermentans TaxID=1473598 RepID=UPI003EB8089C
MPRSLKPPFLPPDSPEGWMPYLWLVYSLPFLLTPAFGGNGLWDWITTLSAYTVFLAAYFRGYWVRGRQLPAIIGVFCLLAIVFAKGNPSALVFFVYAASFTPELGEPRKGWLGLGLVMAIELATVTLLGMHWHRWAAPAIFTPLVGLMVMHYSQRRRLTLRLIQTQGELARMAQIAERERIARDLHDLLGHTLSVIVLKSELASRLAEIDTQRAISEIRDVERISREALAEVRAAVRGYRSAGLMAEVESARQALRSAGIELECDLGSGPLPAAQEGVLALAIREACTNVVRHARATRCRMALRRGPRQYELEIADDGQGGTASEGAGLSGMRERVEALGGTLEHDGSSGMRLLLRLPLEAV